MAYIWFAQGYLEKGIDIWLRSQGKVLRLCNTCFPRIVFLQNTIKGKNRYMNDIEMQYDKLQMKIAMVQEEVVTNMITCVVLRLMITRFDR